MELLTFQAKTPEDFISIKITPNSLCSLLNIAPILFLCLIYLFSYCLNIKHLK